jgi:hypothetical protein
MINLISLLLLVLVYSSALGENTLLIIDSEATAGDTCWVAVEIENSDEIVSFQFDLIYPSNFIYTGIANLSDRAADHELYAEIIDGALRVVALSGTLASISGDSGIVVTLGLFTPFDYGTHNVEMSNPILGNIHSENVISGYSNGTILVGRPTAGSLWYVTPEGSNEVGNGSIDSPFNTIQYGLSISQDADTVIVHPGIYVENLDFLGKNIVLGSLTLTTGDTSWMHQTIIDGNGLGSVVIFNNSEDSTATLCGFTIQNGNADPIGGGIFCSNANPTFTNLLIHQNYAVEKAGGLYLNQSNAQLRNIIVRSNSAGDDGGGIYCLSSNPDIENIKVLSNSAIQGGGMFLNASSPTIVDFDISGNTSVGHGGGLSCWYSLDPLFSRGIIANNSAGSNGGGVFLFESDPQFVNVTISDNVASGIAGGIYNYNSNYLLSNSILWNNSFDQLFNQSGAVNVTYSDIQGTWEGDGNINLDPLFSYSQNHPYFLTRESPCIDAANPSSPIDADGTNADMGAFYYDQNDITPPQVVLNYPTLSGYVETGENLVVTWIASDNVELGWAKLFFTSDSSESYTLSDSVDANVGELDWIAPDIISNYCNFAILISDLAGNVSADTLEEYFTLRDATDPTISILSPTQLNSVQEYDTLAVTWEASDNIGIEYFEFFYSIDPVDVFQSIAIVSSNMPGYDFIIGSGVTDSARFKISVMDIAGNMSEDISEYFSISDNTSPSISYFSIPDTMDWGIGSLMDISVVAWDNVEITGLDLNYTTDSGESWWPIVEHLYPVQGRPTYSWLIPDIPGECQIQAVVTDAVGLTDTSYSEIFSIFVEYPQMIASHAEIRPDGDMHLMFSQLMDSLDIVSGTEVFGSVHGAYDITVSLSGFELTISSPLGFVSLDTLMIVLTSSLWTNSLGYGLDGNGDGQYDGNSIDNDTSNTIVTAAGDYDQNGVLDFDDFDDFVIAWNNDVSEYELAPHQGEVPFINIQPDSSFDIFDLATFASMWNWAAGISLSAPFTESYQYEEFISVQSGNELEVSLPLSDFVASQTIIKYDPSVVQILVADDALAKVSSSALSLVDVNPDSGLILITSSHLTDSNDDDLNLKLLPDTKQRYSIEIAFQGSDMDANVVQKRSLVELLPIPISFSLSQNYPNPFNASTTIEYGLPKNSDLSISIYDIRGRFVKDIFSGEQQAGYHLTHWDASDESGRNVASGLYFIVLNTPEYRVAKKALILK